MKNLLPKVAWDYLVGAIVGVAAFLVVLILVGFTAQLFSSTSETGELLRRGWFLLGLITLVGVLLTVTVYELLVRQISQGRMLEPGTISSKLLSREVIIRAALSGAEAGVYVTVTALVFALLAHGAANLSLFWVLLFGLLPAFVLIAAGALAYAYLGKAVGGHYGKLESRERITLLVTPLAFAVVSGLLFGAATGNALGVVSAIAGAVLTYFVVRSLERLRWAAVRNAFKGIPRAGGGPTIKVVSTHKA